MSFLEARIHQGSYGTEKELLNLRTNALAKEWLDIGSTRQRAGSIQVRRVVA